MYLFGATNSLRVDKSACGFVCVVSDLFLNSCLTVNNRLLLLFLSEHNHVRPCRRDFHRVSHSMWTWCGLMNTGPHTVIGPIYSSNPSAVQNNKNFYPPTANGSGRLLKFTHTEQWHSFYYYWFNNVEYQNSTYILFVYVWGRYSSY